MNEARGLHALLVGQCKQLKKTDKTVNNIDLRLNRYTLDEI